MKKCILCGKELRTDEADFCKTCFNVLSCKYKEKKKFQEVIKWHKENQKTKHC
ncbi:hypothetical protein J4429_00320 [Candidatus Pacearchaeota archaeon]|nr:hypothetical protein [Candidatus Pacearchaeota archaeon]